MSRAARATPAKTTVRLVPATVLARALDKDARTIARWCDDGDVEHYVRGKGRARRYQIVVRNDIVIVCGAEIRVE